MWRSKICTLFFFLIIPLDIFLILSRIEADLHHHFASIIIILSPSSPFCLHDYHFTYHFASFHLIISPPSSPFCLHHYHFTSAIIILLPSSSFRFHHYHRHHFASLHLISSPSPSFRLHNHHSASIIIILLPLSSFRLVPIIIIIHFVPIIIILSPSSSFQLPSMENGLLLHFIFFIFLFHFKFRSGNKKNETIQHSRIGKYFLFLFLNIFTSIFFLISNNLFILFFNLNIFFRFGSGPTV